MRYAEAVGAEVIQIFVANPRAWARAAEDPAEVSLLRERTMRAGMPVFAHAPYLINVASPHPELRERSAEAISYSLRRAAQVGAAGLVVHTGSAAGADRDAALGRARECLLPVLDSIGPGDPDLLLEPMAGQGTMLCAAVAEIGPYFNAIGWHPRAAICLDTCHLFAAGHDLAAPNGVEDMLAELSAVAPGRLRLCHANDSKDPCGSRRDRHEAIGRGRLGLAPFEALLRHPATARVPFVVETPGGERGHAADIARLRELRDGAARTPAPSRTGQSGGPSPSRS